MDDGPLSAKVGEPIVNVSVALAVSDPEVPVIVSVYGPAGAELLAVKVRIDKFEGVVVGFGENDAVTPLGNPETERFTLPVNPF